MTADDGLPVRHRALHGGRGSTKSHSFARGLLFRGSVKPERILCAREIQRSIEGSIKKLLDDLIPQMGLGPTNGDGFYHSLQSEIRGRNGTLVSFAGLRTNVASIKSSEGISIAYVTEASAVSQDSITTLTPTVRLPGSEIWWDWNPDQPNDPVDVMFRGGQPPPGSIVREVNYPQNPWFGDPLKSEMEWDRRRDPEKYQHIWLGQYKRNSEARVFHNWRVEEFDHGPEDGVYRFGADWGFSIDPTVLIRCWLEGRTLYVDQEAYAVGCPIDSTPALFAGSDYRDPARWENPSAYPGVPGAHKWPIIADSARPETIDYMKSRGFDIQPAIKGAGSVEDGVEFLKSVDIAVHPRCQHVIDELTFYSWKVDPRTGLVLPVLADKKNHTIDALRYALEAVRRAGGSMDHVSLPRSGSSRTLSMWGAGRAVGGMTR
ncbi:MAG TPA: PBSX family phage terminase large subunit [Allosphingosinicella sp.]|nr:PBSX family phage terminase large subunit [Allosphingosinicella sp.]